MTNHKSSSSFFSGSFYSEELRNQYIESRWLVSIPLSVVNTKWLIKGEQRLDAGYYASDVVSAYLIIENCKFDSLNLQKLTLPIYYPGRFKRVYAETKQDGVAFLKASEMLHFRPVSELYLANKSKYTELCKVESNTILVTRSGSVGRCVLVTERLSKFVISDDALRVRTSNFPEGYVYAFLNTWIGQTLIVKDQYGSSIKHLEPHHLSKIPIPLLPDNEQQSIHNAIFNAYSLRDKANELLDKADELLHAELGLPKFDESLVPYLNAPKENKLDQLNLPHPKAFSIKASELEERFDGSYHVPTAKLAIEYVKSGKYKPTQLSKILTDIFLPNRFKRIYVNKQFGVPFLQGSHLPMMRPYDLKYISKRANEKNIEQCLIHQGYILLTRSGTIGRIGLVSSRFDGWGASEHLLRLVTNHRVAHPGYIAAFLMTPYGQYQLLSKTYGGVVDEITADDTGNVWIPNAPIPVQEKIGQLVIEAFEKKDEASEIEESVIRNLEKRLEQAAMQH